MGMTYIYPPVSVTTLPPVGGATAANQVLEIAELQAIKASTQLIDDTIADDGGAALAKFQTVGGHTGTTSHAWHVDASGNGRVDVRASALPTGAATETTLNNLYNEAVTSGNEANTNALVQIDLIGSKTETAPATDTASSGLNGRLQRIAQRLTSLIALFPASLGSKADAASFAVTWATEDKGFIGSLTETAPASDTASSGLNGRLQRIAQRLTSLIALFPATLGQKTMANSFAVTLASDQSSLPVTPAKIYVTGTLKTAQITVGTSQVRATTDNLAPSATRNRTRNELRNIGMQQIKLQMHYHLKTALKRNGS